MIFKGVFIRLDEGIYFMLRKEESIQVIFYKDIKILWLLQICYVEMFVYMYKEIYITYLFY